MRLGLADRKRQVGIIHAIAATIPANAAGPICNIRHYRRATPCRSAAIRAARLQLTIGIHAAFLFTSGKWR
jgi:hypothetical protein